MQAKLITNNLSLKIISLLLGYSFWFIVSSSHITTMWVKAPICLYNQPNSTFNAPEHVWLQLSGKRCALYALDNQPCAVHIDASVLHPGFNRLAINECNLLLPPSIKLVHYRPSYISITLD